MTARGITNEVYYVAQKARDRYEQRRQRARVCHAPSTTALKAAIGVAATTCSYRDVIDSDLIVLFGRCRERPARVHEVPVPRQEARREDRGRQPAARARPRALLGAVERRERDVRHQDHRRVLPGAHRRRRRLRQRRAQAPARIGRSRSGVHHRAHRRVRRGARGARARVAERSRTGLGRDRRRHGALRTHVRVGDERGARVVDGHHAARARCRERAGDRQSRARARQRRAAGRRAHADPRPLGRAGRRGDGLLRDRVPGGVAIDDESAAPRREVGFPVPTGRASRRPRWWRRRAASSTCSGRAAATSSTCCPRPTSRAPRSRARRCASTRTSS